MRVRALVDCGNYFGDNDNFGDRAVYEVIVRRLLGLFRDAEIDWITLDPELIRRTCPEVRPFVLRERHHWQLIAAKDREPASILTPFEEWRRRRAAPRIAGELRARSLDMGCAADDVDALLAALVRADLVLGAGTGSFSDAFSAHARGLLDTLAGALALGKVAALVSAGLEDVRDEALIAKARDVLPRLHLIACREKLAGPRVLGVLGVDPRACRVTGDEAIELAYEARRESIGDAIGVSVRQASYSEIGDEFLPAIRAALDRASRRHGASLIAIPISRVGPSDPEAIRSVIDGAGAPDPSSPREVLDRVGRCRVAVCGAYHAALFALSQGIPVVALVGSYHYQTKMRGLAAQFDGGCAVIEVDRPDLAEALSVAIDDAWAGAELRRPALLAAARRQIDASRRAYRRLGRLVRRRRWVAALEQFP